MRVATGRSSTDLLTEQVSGVEALAVVWRGIRREPGWFTLAVLGSVVWAGSIVGVSRAVGWAVEHVVEPAAGQGSVTWRAALTGFAVVLGAYLLQAASMLVRRLSAGLVTFRLGATYRRLVTDAYLRLPHSWHRRHPGGQLLSNANADVDTTWRIFMPCPCSSECSSCWSSRGSRCTWWTPCWPRWGPSSSPCWRR